MLPFLVLIALIFPGVTASGSVPSANRTNPGIEWLKKATEPGVTIPVAVTVLGAVFWRIKKAGEVEAELERENFRKALIEDLSVIISDQIVDLQSQIGLKIEKISIQVEYLSKQSKENDHGIKGLEVEIKEIKDLKNQNYQELKSEIGLLGVRTGELMSAIQSSYRYDAEFLARIDAELSSVLSAYLKCPVDIKLFRTRSDLVD